MPLVVMRKKRAVDYRRKFAKLDHAIQAAEVLTRVGDGDKITVYDDKDNVVVTYTLDVRSGLWQKGF